MCECPSSRNILALWFLLITHGTFQRWLCGGVAVVFVIRATILWPAAWHGSIARMVNFFSTAEPYKRLLVSPIWFSIYPVVKSGSIYQQKKRWRRKRVEWIFRIRSLGSCCEMDQGRVIHFLRRPLLFCAGCAKQILMIDGLLILQHGTHCNVNSPGNNQLFRGLKHGPTFIDID